MTGIKKEKKEAWIEFFEIGFVVCFWAPSSHIKHTGPEVIYRNSHKNSSVMVILLVITVSIIIIQITSPAIDFMQMITDTFWKVWFAVNVYSIRKQLPYHMPLSNCLLFFN